MDNVGHVAKSTSPPRIHAFSTIHSVWPVATTSDGGISYYNLICVRNVRVEYPPVLLNWIISKIVNNRSWLIIPRMLSTFTYEMGATTESSELTQLPLNDLEPIGEICVVLNCRS